MTPDQELMIKLAREAGFRAGTITMSDGDSMPFVAPISATTCIVELQRFFHLVAAHQRELDARACEAEAVIPINDDWYRAFNEAVRDCAAAIRGTK